MKEKIKKFGLPWVLLFSIYIICFVSIVFIICRTVYLSSQPLSITSYITPIFGLASLFVAMVTIRYNTVTNKEKNALEFVKDFKEKEIFSSLGKIYKVRKQYYQNDNKTLDRKKIAPYCEKAALLKSEDLKELISKKETLILENKTKQLKEERKYVFSIESKAQIDEKIKTISDRLSRSKEINDLCEFRTSLVKVLNLMERCANGVRYGIYDEGLIYNSYGAQFIEIYEMSFVFIKNRQNEESKLFINAEWLAVKWTLQKEIQEDRPTFATNQKRAIQHANEGLKMHLRAPNKKILEPLLKRMTKLRFPS